jgi:dihydroneopterin aldolase
MPQSEKKAQATTTAPLPTHEAVTQKKAQVTTAAPVPDHSDAIHIKNLQLPFGILAPDVWGQVKQQPALLTIHLPLLRGFHSASDADRLDSSTIHYGTLAKEIRASSRADQTLAEVSQNVGAVIAKLAASGALARSRVLIALPKASMAGESVEITQVTEFGDKGDRIGVETEFAVQDVKVMTLVGVNGYEREAKQPLVVSVRLSTREEHWAPMFQLEQTLVQVSWESYGDGDESANLLQIIQDTTFETLEKLVEFTYQQLRTKVLDATFPGARVQLRIEKPRAIAFADAPAVEISRTVPSA